MTAQTLAGKLAGAFGDYDAMAGLLASDVEWWIPKSLPYPHPIKGLSEVTAFLREVFTEHFGEGSVTILDEVGDDHCSAARILYRAHALRPNRIYENEYMVFVRSDETGIRQVFESVDTQFSLGFLSQEPLP